MTGLTESRPTEALAPTAHGTLALRDGGPRRVAIELAAFAGGFACTFAWADFMGWLHSAPSVVFGAALGIGMLASAPRKFLWAPLLLVLGAGLAWASPMGIPAVLLAGASVGALGAYVRTEESTRLDLANGALAGAAAAGMAAVLLVSGALFGLHPIIGFALVGLLAALAIVPSLVEFRAQSLVPSAKAVEASLAQPYRPPVHRALELHALLRASKPDREMMEGLHEVVSWVYRLAQSIQTLSQDLSAVDDADLIDRIEMLILEAEESKDEFLRDRRLATAEHLKKLLSHADQLRLERERCASMQDYALAYLEEARLGLTLARSLPGEHAPVRLNEVLDKLRGHARDGDARRRTAREVQSLSA